MDNYKELRAICVPARRLKNRNMENSTSNFDGEIGKWYFTGEPAWRQIKWWQTILFFIIDIIKKCKRCVVGTLRN